MAEQAGLGWRLQKHGEVYTVQGRRRQLIVYSVTSATGQLSDYSMVPPEAMRRAINFGNAVHKATAMLDSGQRWVKLDPGLEAPVEAWKKFKRDYDVEVISAETPVWSAKHLFAGTPDRIARVRGVLSVIDLKTRAFNPLPDPLQTAAYLEAWNEMFKAQVRGRLVVELGAGTEYKVSPLQEKKQKEHFKVFLGALALYSWKKSKGGMV